MSEPLPPSGPWDVVIIGGGPAGATAATFLAQAGRRVLVLEKSKFPRFHIGESLLPYNRGLFEEMGVWPKIRQAGFMLKRGAQFWMGNGSRHTRLDFSRGAFTEFPESLQVERAKFDQILLDHARSCGAEVREECLVLEHRVLDDRVRLRCRGADGAAQEIEAAFLIDASGLANVTGNRESQRRYYEGHKKVAIFGHFDGVRMPEGEELGDILIVRRNRSWFWLIPLDERRTSVGLVLDRADFQALGGTPQQVFEAAVRDTAVTRERLQEAVRQTELHVASDFSYQNERLVSPRLVRAGDASGFIDPVFSSGVMLAMTSGRDAARAVDEALDSGRPLTAGMRRYEAATRRRIGQFWEFIENFYRNHFAQLFFQPLNRMHLVCAVNAVLAGRTELPLAVRWRLRLFFLIARIHRRFPLAERLAIE